MKASNMVMAPAGSPPQRGPTGDGPGGASGGASGGGGGGGSSSGSGSGSGSGGRPADDGHDASTTTPLVLSSPAVHYVCTYEDCNRFFDRKYNLRVHMRRHTGERPYVCAIENCGKRFKWGSSLSHHKRAHANAKLRAARQEDQDAQRSLSGLGPELLGGLGGSRFPVGGAGAGGAGAGAAGAGLVVGDPHLTADYHAAVYARQQMRQGMLGPSPPPPPPPPHAASAAGAGAGGGGGGGGHPPGAPAQRLSGMPVAQRQQQLIRQQRQVAAAQYLQAQAVAAAGGMGGRGGAHGPAHPSMARGRPSERQPPPQEQALPPPLHQQPPQRASGASARLPRPLPAAGAAAAPPSAAAGTQWHDSFTLDLGALPAALRGGGVAKADPACLPLLPLGGGGGGGGGSVGSTKGAPVFGDGAARNDEAEATVKSLFYSSPETYSPTSIFRRDADALWMPSPEGGATPAYAAAPAGGHAKGAPASGATLPAAVAGLPKAPDSVDAVAAAVEADPGDWLRNLDQLGADAVNYDLPSLGSYF